jgi:lysyl-tRNA synthetase class 2
MRTLARLFSRAYEAGRISALSGFSYPRARVTHSLAQFQQEFGGIPAGTILREQGLVAVAGRVLAIRDQGRKLVFLDLGAGLHRLQLVFSQDQAGSLDSLRTIKRGDIVSGQGRAGRTKRG